MNNTLKQAAQVLREDIEDLMPVSDVPEAMDRIKELERIAAELDRMAQIEPAAWQDTHKLSEIYEHDQLDPQWYNIMRPLYTHPQPTQE